MVEVEATVGHRSLTQKPEGGPQGGGASRTDAESGSGSRSGINSVDIADGATSTSGSDQAGAVQVLSADAGSCRARFASEAVSTGGVVAASSSGGASFRAAKSTCKLASPWWIERSVCRESPGK